MLWPAGGQTSLEELEAKLRRVWGDAARILPIGTDCERAFSPSMVEALTKLVDGIGAHVVWHTSWVIWPYMLTDLIQRLGLPVGVQLDGGGSHPRAWSRLKTSAIRNRIVAFREQVEDAGPVVVIDDDAQEWGRELNWLLGAEVIIPRATLGLTPQDLERARRVLTGPAQTPFDPDARREPEPGVSTDF